MRNWLGLVIVSAMGVIGVSACSSSPAEKYPSVDSFCAAKAEQECTAVSPVCAVSIDACKTKRADVCNVGAGAALAAGRKYTPSRVDDCLDKVKKAYASNVVSPTVYNEMTDACERVFVGSIANFQACKSTYECAGSSAVCDKGLCGDKSTKKLGEGCANPGETCDANSFCTKNAPNVCAARPSSGQPCSADAPCGAGLRCNVQCVAAARAGDACGVDADCEAAAPYCNHYDGNVCSAGLIFSPAEKALCRDYGGNG